MGYPDRICNQERVQNPSAGRLHLVLAQIPEVYLHDSGAWVRSTYFVADRGWKRVAPPSLGHYLNGGVQQGILHRSKKFKHRSNGVPSTS